MRRLHLTALVLLLACGGEGVACSKQAEAKFSPSLVDAWQDQESGRQLNIESNRIIELKDGHLTVRGLIRQDGSRLELRNQGLKETWTASVSRGILRLEPVHKGKNTGGVFRRLDQVPPDLKLEPLPVASARSLPPERIQAIQTEIKGRFQAEQALLKNRNAPRDQVAAVQGDNLSYLKRLLAEVGWTDARRFGAKTSVFAVIMAKHTHDLRLMMTLLPYAEKDLKNSGDGQTYAVLFDGLQLELGGKQLYGTQVAKDERGHPYVLPMQESKEQVDKRLDEMGLPKLDEYLDVVSQAFYPGQRIECCRQDG
jgi:hypothetical protein